MFKNKIFKISQIEDETPIFEISGRNNIHFTGKNTSSARNFRPAGHTGGLRTHVSCGVPRIYG